MQATTQATQQRRGFEYKWIMAFVLIIGVFMSILDTTIVNIAIPRLQSAFGTDLNSVQWVLNSLYSDPGRCKACYFILCGYPRHQAFLHYRSHRLHARLGIVWPGMELACADSLSYSARTGRCSTLRGTRRKHGTTRSAAIQLIALEVQRQGYMLAFQDAFFLSLLLVGLAIIATFFIRIKRRPRVIPGQAPQEDAPEAREAEPVFAA